MEHKEHLEKLNAESLKKIEAYIRGKRDLKPEAHEKIRSAKEEWQLAWNKLMEAMLVFERIEI